MERQPVIANFSQETADEKLDIASIEHVLAGERRLWRLRHR